LNAFPRSSRERLDAAEHALLQSVRDHETDSQSLRSAFLSVFRALDVNKTGLLSLDELKRGLRSIGHELSDLEAQVGL
jgi:Ca2+-binding EF-hand superfamily protein